MRTPVLKSDAAASSTLLDVRAVARMLDCSTRHVYRLRDSGLMPLPIRVGALVRWQRHAIAAWIDGGCHPVRQQGGRSSGRDPNAGSGS
jgi:predicted DNA-binding transcriptional regulator AlpA